MAGELLSNEAAAGELQAQQDVQGGFSLRMSTLGLPSDSICAHSAAERMLSAVTLGCAPTGRRNSKQLWGLNLQGKAGTGEHSVNSSTNVVFAGTEVIALMPQALETRPRSAAKSPRASHAWFT
jgi:hypothetical protein